MLENGVNSQGALSYPLPPFGPLLILIYTIAPPRVVVLPHLTMDRVERKNMGQCINRRTPAGGGAVGVGSPSIRLMGRSLSVQETF